ncbi:MAG: phosphoadenosine phosphosulfate reductase [Acidobacteria bacterium]|nr:phosphoadenosine phosphosulfate reductase [Acidobacteriota bacterium]
MTALELTPLLTNDVTNELRNELTTESAEGFDAAGLIHSGLDSFGAAIAIASSFGAEDVVLIDLASRRGLPFRVFALDTDFLFPETYALIEEIEANYGVEVERCRPSLTPEEQALAHGEALWASNPDRCCAIRKIEPLKAKLGTLKAWITGIRRDQAPTRANTKKLEWDDKFALWKLNPLADWSSERVWSYIRAESVPYNPLHDQSYPSIGCTWCTRPVKAGEDPRAGRWAGFAKTECGLHKG